MPAFCSSPLNCHIYHQITCEDEDEPEDKYEDEIEDEDVNDDQDQYQDQYSQVCL